jgi:hypothetical protein
MQDSQPRFVPLAVKTVVCHSITYMFMGALAYNGNKPLDTHVPVL